MTSLALGVPLTVVSLLGLVLNIYILLIVVLTKQVQNANNLLLLHLGVIDSTLSLTFLVFSAPEMLKGWTPLGLNAPCNLHGFLLTLLHPLALWTICGLNCDRYYAITSPLHYGSVVSVRKVAMGLGLTWIISFALCLPPLFKVAPYKHNPFMAGCAPDFTTQPSALWYSVTYTTVTCLLPAVLILGCNLRVLMIARYHRHRIASAIFEVTLSAQVTITHQRNPFIIPGSNYFRGRRAVATVVQLIGSFFLLYFPHYGVILWESGSTKLLPGRPPPIIISLAHSLLTCSPPVNGLLYGIKSKVLRTTFNNYWRKKKTKCEVQQEIQARTPSTCGSRRPSLGPLARPSSGQLHRRLSEVFSPTRPAMQRISSELTWRPQSSFFLNFQSNSLRRSSSCRDPFGPNTISTIEIPNFKMFRVALATKKPTTESDKDISSPDLFVNHVSEQQKKSMRRSPKILITRAFSEESEPSPPAKESPINRLHSSSANTLIEKRWKKIRYKTDENVVMSSDNSLGSNQTESESLIFFNQTTKSSDDSSSSTSDEEHSSGNIYVPFEETTSPHKRFHYSTNGHSWPMRRNRNCDLRIGLGTAKSVEHLSRHMHVKLNLLAQRSR